MAINQKKTIALLIALNAITLLAVALLVGLLLGQRSDSWSPLFGDRSEVSSPATGAKPPEGRTQESRIGEEASLQPQRQQQGVDPMRQQEDAPSSRRVSSQGSSAVGTKQMLPTKQVEKNGVEIQVAEPAALSDELRQTVNDWQSDQNEHERKGKPEVLADEVEGSGSKVDVYYRGNMVRIEEVDERGTTLVSISNTMIDVEKLAAGDKDYLAALDELKNGSRSHITMKRPGDVKRAASESTGSQVEQTNYYNKVNLNERQPEYGNRSGLAAQIESIVSGETDTSSADQEPDISETPHPTEDQPTDSDTYVHALKKEYVERANEMRTIRVQEGDSLWKIAEKAYGDGFSYKRLVTANPHLTNPDLLKIGDLLRVPL